MSPRLARVAYTVGWWLALPFAAVYLVWRSVRQREYLSHWGERFLGRGPAFQDGAPVIWLHAVSVGETRAAQPLIEALAQAYPQSRFVLTHMTPTGRAVGAAIAGAAPGRVVQRYLPYDLPFAVRRFLREARPSVGVLMETEAWPNLLLSARDAGVPVVLVNARLSQKSAAQAQRFAALLRPATANLARIAAQSEADRARLARIYDGPIDVLGNLKFDNAPAPALIEQGRSQRARWGGPVWLAASSREGEERLIIDAYARLAKSSEVRRLLIVPRHPQRFDEVARLIRDCGFDVVRRSSPAWNEPARGRTVLLGDSMGEMAMYYGAADLTLMGGSLLPFGAQNLIESCAVGTPVVLGPSTFNFAQASTDAIAAGAAVQVADADAALAVMNEVTRDRARLETMRAAALTFANTHRGATARTAALVSRLIANAPAAG